MQHLKINNLCGDLEVTIRRIDEKIIDRNTFDAAKVEYCEHQAILRCGEYPAITRYKNGKFFMRYIYVDKCKDLCLPF